MEEKLHNQTHMTAKNLCT